MIFRDLSKRIFLGCNVCSL